MSKKPSENTRDDIVNAALEIAAKEGWAALSLEMLAKKSGLSPDELYFYFAEKEDILSAFGRMIDRKVLENITENAQGEGVPLRDMLFDVLMERFEILNEYRAAVIAILDSLSQDYSQGIL